MMKWKKRSLFFILTAAIVSAAVVACIYFIPPLRKKNNSPLANMKSLNNSDSPVAEQAVSPNICATEDCVLAAARVLKYLDMKADPCVDFYNFACGNFLHSHSVPEGWESYGSTDIVNEQVDLIIKGIMEEPKKIDENDSLSRVKRVYKTCMNVSRIEDSTVQDLKEVLSKHGVGDWPLLNPEWKDCRLDIEWRMAKLNSLGIDSLFHLETQFRGDEDRLFAIISVAPPLVDGICDDVANATEALQKASEHREILQTVLSLLDVKTDNVTDLDIDDLFEFDYLFCNVTKISRQNSKDRFRRGNTPNMTLLNLAAMAPQINWIRWRNIIFSDLLLKFPDDKQNIYVDRIEASILGINDLLHNTSSKVLANYLTWRFVFHHLGFLGKPFRQILEDHSKLMAPKIGRLLMNSDRWIPRWRQCVIYVKELMPIAILPEYSAHIHLDEREKEMRNVVMLVANEFRMILKDTRDLLQHDKMRSSHKIDLIQFPLTLPNRDSKFFSKYYSDMGNMEDSFLKNGLKLRAFRIRKLLEGVARSKTIFDMEYAIQLIYSTFGIDTYSFFRGNQIVVSLGALESCPTRHKLPTFLTLSTFGWTIGHELAHGFDLLALDGKTHSNWTWWPSYVLKFAQTKAQCYLEFYPSYGVNKIDEAVRTTTLNEDLCDSQGIYLAYRAYLKYLKYPHGPDASLPGLPFSNLKLFFISYAQQFCEIRQEDGSRSLHSPGRQRVNRVLQNFAPFSEVFACPRDKPMNSPKCDNIWI